MLFAVAVGLAFLFRVVSDWLLRWPGFLFLPCAAGAFLVAWCSLLVSFSPLLVSFCSWCCALARVASLCSVRCVSSDAGLFFGWGRWLLPFLRLRGLLSLSLRVVVPSCLLSVFVSPHSAPRWCSELVVVFTAAAPCLGSGARVL